MPWVEKVIFQPKPRRKHVEVILRKMRMDTDGLHQSWDPRALMASRSGKRVTLLQAQKSERKVEATGPSGKVTIVIGLVDIRQGHGAGRLGRVTGTDGVRPCYCGARPRDRPYLPRRNLDNESDGLSLTELGDDILLDSGMLPIYA